MTKELIHFNEGNVTWHGAVGQLASALSPLGAAANVIANIGACAVEISRFRLEAKRLSRQHAVASDILHARQYTIAHLFETEKYNAMHLHVQLEELSSGYRKIIDMACDMRISQEERLEAMGIAQVICGNIVQLYIARGDQLIRLSDSLRLGDTEAGIAAWRQIQG